MNELTLRTPVRAIFGLAPDGGEAALVDLLRQWGETLINLRTSLLPFDWPGLPYRRLLQLSTAVEERYLALIARWRAAGLTGNDALTMLIRWHDDDPDHLTRAQLIGQINNLFNAGNTSRATILTWTLFLLAQHPAALAGVLHELDRRVGGPAPTLAEQLDPNQDGRVTPEEFAAYRAPFERRSYIIAGVMGFLVASVGVIWGEVWFRRRPA